MKIDNHPEIVEVIDDVSGAFHDRSPGSTGVDAGGRRWVGPVAVVALAGLIGYGVVTSAPSSAPLKPPPPTTTPSSASAIPRDRFTVPPFYVADPPDGFVVQSAESLVDEVAGPAELWATPGASAVSGSWFIVSEGARHATGRNAYRTVVNDIEVVIEHDPPSGQTRLAFSKNGHDLEITAFGWADRQLRRLATSVSVEGATIRYADKFFSTDHQLVAPVDPWRALYGTPATRVEYVSADASQQFTITVGADQHVDQEVLTQFTLGDAMVSFGKGEVPEFIGSAPGDPLTSIEQWHDGDKVVTVTGNLDQPAMIKVAFTVRPAAFDALDLDLRLVREAHMPSESWTIGSGMMADGYASTIGVGVRGDRYVWTVGQPDGSVEPRPSQAGPAASVETLVEHGRTYVFAKAPRSEVAPRLRVYRNGLPTISTDLADLSSTVPDVFAAYVFLEPVPFSAEIVGADGNVIATWPTIAS